MRPKIKSLIAYCKKSPITLLIVGAAVLAMALAMMSQNPSPPEGTMKSSQRPPSIDTLIPPGQVLIPIEVQNFASLDSILGSHGVVDLYAPSLSSGQPSQVVARAIKILRSPQNPHHFAVLAPESQARQIVQHPGAFYVVIQSPKRVGTDIVESQPQRRRIIIETKE